MKSRAFSLVAVFLLVSVPLALSQTSTDPPSTSNQTTPPAASGTQAPVEVQPQANEPQGSAPAATSQNQTPAPANPPQDTNPPASSQPQAKSPNVKAGSEDDVSAIGNRSVGKGVNWYSLEKEIRMGKEFAQQVESSARLVQDPVVNEFVNRVGQNLVRNSDARVPFTIKVIDSDEINAFALPGGFFYVNSGLILAADEEAELAGVMAHEIAHVAARHATRQMTRGQLANLASLPLIFMGGGIGYAIGSAAGLGLPLTFMSFSRSFEAEADYLGLEYMYKTGYDPQAFIAFFEKIQAKEKKKPGTLSKAFASHPQTPDRIAKSQVEIARILPPRPEYLVTTSEFDDVKARLAAIENRHKLEDKKNGGNRPTLRRTTNDSGQGTGTGTSSDSKDTSSQQDDGRPTLKRRDQD